jgi:hypothetical protein
MTTTYVPLIVVKLLLDVSTLKPLVMITTHVLMILAITYPVVQTLKLTVMMAMPVLKITVALPLDALIHT